MNKHLSSYSEFVEKIDREISVQYTYNSFFFIKVTSLRRDTRWRSWLRHCATSRKVAGSNPDGVIGIFH